MIAFFATLAMGAGLFCVYIGLEGKSTAFGLVGFALIAAVLFGVAS